MLQPESSLQPEAFGHVYIDRTSLDGKCTQQMDGLEHVFLASICTASAQKAPEIFSFIP